MSANEGQVGGDHYKATFQHWDWVEALGLPYLVSAASKYLTRWRKKDGSKDVQKSIHYLQKQLEVLHTSSNVRYTLTDRFIRENKLGHQEAYVMHELRKAFEPDYERIHQLIDHVELILADAREHEGLPCK